MKKYRIISYKGSYVAQTRKFIFLWLGIDSELDAPRSDKAVYLWPKEFFGYCSVNKLEEAETLIEKYRNYTPAKKEPEIKVIKYL